MHGLLNGMWMSMANLSQTRSRAQKEESSPRRTFRLPFDITGQSRSPEWNPKQILRQFVFHGQNGRLANQKELVGLSFLNTFDNDTNGVEQSGQNIAPVILAARMQWGGTLFGNPVAIKFPAANFKDRGVHYMEVLETSSQAHWIYRSQFALLWPSRNQVSNQI